MSKAIDAITDHEIRELLLEALESLPKTPSTVYRLQLNSQFNFSEARKIIPYLKKLGIEAFYASPYFKAKSGSAHGYDIIDPKAINPELGTQEDFDQFCQTLQDEKMGHLIDVVPNHMGIGSSNQMWMDVLENGPSSSFAHYFDIDWEPEKRELKDKVLIPILGDHYGRALENQELQIKFSNEGTFWIQYWEHCLPVAPKTYPLILKFNLHKLEELLGEKDKAFLEFLNAITILDNLPFRSDANQERIDERNHEKEIAKERLASIIKRSKEIRAFVIKNIEIFNGRKGDRKSFDLLDELLNEQAYRMAYWRVASEEINYRRFFDVNELAAIRIEDERVFQDHHELVFRLIREGKVTGLRIDHPDGLYNPPEYFRKLQFERWSQILTHEWSKRHHGGKALDQKTRAKLHDRLHYLAEAEAFEKIHPLYVVAEKILERKEQLPSDWKVDGTVGYEFLNALSGIFVDSDQADAFDEIYQKYTGTPFDFEQATYEKKKFFALVHMASEINSLAQRLDRISERDRRYRDYTLNNFTVALREIIACFPVYRTYITPDAIEVSERDQKYIHIAIEKAKSKTPALPFALYDFLKDILLLNLRKDLSHEDERLYRDFILRFQQITGPIMAKGLEDTAFYVYNRLISLNEVGGHPESFGNNLHEFHRINMEQAKNWPRSFTTTSTHDTKRSEDVRMRIHVLSEVPLEWQSELAKWTTLNEKHKTLVGDRWAPDANTEYFIYQTLLGAWPLGNPKGKDYREFIQRIWGAIEKSIREAKVFTNWVNPNVEYESGVKKFLDEILSPKSDNHFLELFLNFQRRISAYGMLNSLSAIALKIASPGAVDTYQGTELWDYSLVDPDNRRPVDFKAREKILSDVIAKAEEDPSASIKQFLKNKEDGHIKLYLLWKGLHFRNRYPDIFIEGHYEPLKIAGSREKNVVAFLRQKDQKVAICIASRFFSELESGESGKKPLWKDSYIILPENVSQETLQEIYTGRTVKMTTYENQPALCLDSLFDISNFAMLTNQKF